MSRSQPSIKNPATRFFKWKGSEGKVVWYDKEAEQEKEMPFTADEPFTFLVLDELNTVTGFNDKEKSSFWSNEVRGAKDSLTVRTASGVKYVGPYKKNDVVQVPTGAKYAKSVYIAFKDESGELVIGNFKLSGAALTAWIELQKKYDVYQCAIDLEGSTEATKGTTTYFVPVFGARNASEQTNQAASVLDKELQSYLRTYLSREPEEESIDEDDDEATDGPADGPAAETAPEPVSEPKTAPAAPAKATDVNEGDKTIKLKDVPF